MTKLSQLLLVSDIDGTALVAEEGIPPQNIEAVRRFVGKGGHFTFATGRSPEMARIAYDAFVVNAPMICLNGSILYDGQRDEIVEEYLMPPSVHQTARELVERLDGRAGVLMVCGNAYYAVAHSPLSIGTAQRNLLVTPQVCSIEKVPQKVYKVLLTVPDEEMVPELRREIGEQYSETYTVMQSGEKHVELLPQGVSKGSTLHRLTKKLGIAQEHVVAIGDNENDAQMLDFAGYSAAPENAMPLIRQQADVVLCPCMSGALAQLIQILEDRYPE